MELAALRRRPPRSGSAAGCSAAGAAIHVPLSRCSGPHGRHASSRPAALRYIFVPPTGQTRRPETRSSTHTSTNHHHRLPLTDNNRPKGTAAITTGTRCKRRCNLPRNGGGATVRPVGLWRLLCADGIYCMLPICITGSFSPITVYSK